MSGRMNVMSSLKPFDRNRQPHRPSVQSTTLRRFRYKPYAGLPLVACFPLPGSPALSLQLWKTLLNNFFSEEAARWCCIKYLNSSATRSLGVSSLQPHPNANCYAMWSVAVFDFGLHHNSFPVNRETWPCGHLTESDIMKQGTSFLSALYQ